MKKLLLATLCKPGSSHRLELKITLDETRTGYAHFVVEGRVMDADNRSMAAFTTNQKASGFLKAPNYTDACKKFVQKVASDML